MESETTQSALFYDLYRWLDRRKKHVAWAIVGVVAAALVVGFLFWRGNARQENANIALSQAISRGWANARPEPAESFLKVASEFPGTAAGGRALLMSGASQFHDGKFADSEAQFRKYLGQSSGGHFAAQASFGVAASLDAG